MYAYRVHLWEQARCDLLTLTPERRVRFEARIRALAERAHALSVHHWDPRAHFVASIEDRLIQYRMDPRRMLVEILSIPEELD